MRRDVVTSERMADLLDEDGFAYGVFMNAKAVCDDYGRLPANPRKFKALAAPMSAQPPKVFAAALTTLEKHGVIERYAADGDEYLQIVAYNEVEDTQWYNVGRPDYPAPPGWQPPRDLVEHLLQATDKRIKPERYGLTPQQIPGWPEKVGEAYPDDTPIEGEGSVHSDSTSVSDSVVQEEVNGNDNLAEEEEAPPEFAPRGEGRNRDDAHMLLQNHQGLVAAVRDVYGRSWLPARQQDFVCDAAAALTEPGCIVTEAESVVAIRGDQKPLPDQKGGWWIGWLCNEKRKASRASPPPGNAPAPPGTFKSGRAAPKPQRLEKAQ